MATSVPPGLGLTPRTLSILFPKLESVDEMTMQDDLEEIDKVLMAVLAWMDEDMEAFRDAMKTWFCGEYPVGIGGKACLGAVIDGIRDKIK